MQSPGSHHQTGLEVAPRVRVPRWLIAAPSTCRTEHGLFPVPGALHWRAGEEQPSSGVLNLQACVGADYRLFIV